MRNNLKYETTAFGDCVNGVKLGKALAGKTAWRKAYRSFIWAARTKHTLPAIVDESYTTDNITIRIYGTVHHSPKYLRPYALSPERLAEYKAWSALTFEALMSFPENSGFYRVTVTRYVGRKPTTLAYEFPLETSANLCWDWWKKRGGISTMELAEVRPIKQYENHDPDPYGVPY